MGWGVVDRNFFFFEFSLFDFSPDKKKKKKVGWEYIFKVDILKWWGGTFYFREYIFFPSNAA